MKMYEIKMLHLPSHSRPLGIHAPKKEPYSQYRPFTLCRPVSLSVACLFICENKVIWAMDCRHKHMRTSSCRCGFVRLRNQSKMCINRAVEISESRWNSIETHLHLNPNPNPTPSQLTSMQPNNLSSNCLQDTPWHPKRECTAIPFHQSHITRLVQNIVYKGVLT